MASDEETIAQRIAELTVSGFELMADLVVQSRELKEGIADGIRKRTAEGKASPLGKKGRPQRAISNGGRFFTRLSALVFTSPPRCRAATTRSIYEVRELYRLDRKSTAADISNYRISDYVQGSRIMQGGVEASTPWLSPPPNSWCS
jgi:hypothetical protein